MNPVSPKLILLYKLLWSLKLSEIDFLNFVKNNSVIGKYRILTDSLTDLFLVSFHDQNILCRWQLKSYTTKVLCHATVPSTKSGNYET